MTHFKTRIALNLLNGYFLCIFANQAEVEI